MFQNSYPAVARVRSRFLSIASGALLLGALVLSMLASPAAAQDQPQQPQSPTYNPDEVSPPTSAPAAALGASIYAESCAPCHGNEGNSDGPVVANLPAPPPMLTDPATVAARSPAEWFHIIKYGRIGQLMPPWQNQLSDDEIWQVLYYSWSLHTSADAVDEGAALFESAIPADEEALDSFLNDPQLLFSTQDELQATLDTQFASASWSEAELTAAADYVRARSYIPPWESAYRAGDGLLDGAVTLATAAADTQSLVSGLPVTLTAFINFEPVETFTTATDENGKFAFDQLSTDANVAYLMETHYKGIGYGSGVVQFAESAEQNAEIPVYEPTDDPSGVQLDRANWIIDFEPGSVVVGQILSFGSSADAAFTGQEIAEIDAPVTVELPLPAQATDVQFQDGTLGERFRRAGAAVYDTLPVTPGEATRQIFMSYRLPAESASVAFAQPLAYEAGSMNVLVADLPDLEVEVSELAYAGVDSIQNINYRLWSGEQVAAQPIEVAIDGALTAGSIDPRALAAPNAAGGAENSASAGGASNANLPAAVDPLPTALPYAVGGVVLLSILGVFVWSRQSAGRANHAAYLRGERQALVAEIAALDDSHARGELADAAWQAERAELKEALLRTALELEQVAQKESVDG